ncbi:MAG: uracil-xanthine permease [Frankiales bacterium]|nr:uracil-xanthine permease [Frankiales bacterium]
MKPLWTLHGDGRTVRPGEVVAPEERLAWPLTIGVGAQHVLAMFGATFLVPLLTGFPVSTTLLFSGVGTLLFLLITRGRVPSYLGSSFAFIAPIQAVSFTGGTADPAKLPLAVGGLLVTGLVLAGVGLLVQAFGTRWLNAVLPPVVTGAVVALIGLNLVGVAKANYSAQPGIATVTLVSVLLLTVSLRGFLGRLSIVLGVVVGWVLATLLGSLDDAAVDRFHAAALVGLPDFTAPRFSFEAASLFVPVVVVLVAENVGHVKAVASMTERDLDPELGRTLFADGVATSLAGLGGGSGTTTYAENIGVMAATRVYSTAAYGVAGVAAVLLALSPKFGALVATIPAGVLGGVTTALYGLIAVLGVRIFVESRVDFRDPANLFPVAIALVVGAADYTLEAGRVSFNGIALGTFAVVVGHAVMRAIGRRTGVSEPLADPASLPDADQR